ARRLELHYAPKHGSWLNMAEIELSVLQRQCLGRRIGSRQTLEQETAAWETARNACHASVNWRLTTDKAPVKSCVGFTSQKSFDGLPALNT
ncbi:MAG: transposase, partial [Anaerolineae bacterium]